ncbi:MAG: sensor histidine kinase [Microbacteriaceae bacterium]
MTPEAARIFVLPREVASDVITTAVCRGALGVGIASIILTMPVVVDTLAHQGRPDAMLVPLAALLGILVLLIVLVRWQTATSWIIYLIAGSALAFIFGVAMLQADPQLSGDGSFVLNRPLIALVLVGGSTRRPATSLALAGSGFACATFIGLATAAVAGVQYSPGWGPILALALFASSHLALALVRASQNRTVPDLVKLEQETRSAALESQFEQRAAAIIHDTVLNDLAVVMNAPAILDDRARARLRADVATLSDASWLSESGSPALLPVDDANLRNAVVTMVTEFQWRGLTVDVADYAECPVRYSPAAATAILAATRACLENVVQHANVTAAEVILSSSPSSATMMIVDSGDGFDLDAVASDRLGIRASIVQRMEAIGGTVKIWSRPGSGTSIMLSAPYDVDAAHAE